MSNARKIGNPEKSPRGELHGDEIAEILNWIEHEISDAYDRIRATDSLKMEVEQNARISALEDMRSKFNDELRNR